MNRTAVSSLTGPIPQWRVPGLPSVSCTSLPHDPSDGKVYPTAGARAEWRR
jgi:hypothetical protein